ncbi:hypothetical protein VNO77_02682 [Canavalia gladiata]|uniref:Uncharacterized protein n=1 Tax=Canavalia gladiata TaxID=3824 RepID=A0AAN9MYF8_CANGL
MQRLRGITWALNRSPNMVFGIRGPKTTMVVILIIKLVFYGHLRPDSPMFEQAEVPNNQRCGASIIRLLFQFLGTLSSHARWLSSLSRHVDHRVEVVINVARGKLLNSLNALRRKAYSGDIILQTAKGPLSLSAVAKGPKLRLLGLLFRKLRKRDADENALENELDDSPSDILELQILRANFRQNSTKNCLHGIWYPWSQVYETVQRKVHKEVLLRSATKIGIFGCCCREDYNRSDCSVAAPTASVQYHTLLSDEILNILIRPVAARNKLVTDLNKEISYTSCHQNKENLKVQKQLLAFWFGRNHGLVQTPFSLNSVQKFMTEGQHHLPCTSFYSTAIFLVPVWVSVYLVKLLQMKLIQLQFTGSAFLLDYLHSSLQSNLKYNVEQFKKSPKVKLSRSGVDFEGKKKVMPLSDRGFQMQSALGHRDSSTSMNRSSSYGT